jgi:hypothetical protein
MKNLNNSVYNSNQTYSSSVYSGSIDSNNYNPIVAIITVVLTIIFLAIVIITIVSPIKIKAQTLTNNQTTVNLQNLKPDDYIDTAPDSAKSLQTKGVVTWSGNAFYGNTKPEKNTTPEPTNEQPPTPVVTQNPTPNTPTNTPNPTRPQPQIVNQTATIIQPRNSNDINQVLIESQKAASRLALISVMTPSILSTTSSADGFSYNTKNNPATTVATATNNSTTSNPTTTNSSAIISSNGTSFNNSFNQNFSQPATPENKNSINQTSGFSLAIASQNKSLANAVYNTKSYNFLEKNALYIVLVLALLFGIVKAYQAYKTKKARSTF